MILFEILLDVELVLWLCWLKFYFTFLISWWVKHALIHASVKLGLIIECYVHCTILSLWFKFKNIIAILNFLIEENWCIIFSITWWHWWVIVCKWWIISFFRMSRRIFQPHHCKLWGQLYLLSWLSFSSWF